MPRGWRLALAQDFIAGRLGLPAVTDPSLATRTMLLDGITRSWSPDLLDALQIDIDHLPRVVDAGTEIGTIDTRGKEAFGLRQQCAYVVGGLDAACVAMGVGAIEPGRCVLSMGTVASIGAVLRTDADGGIVPTGPHVVPQRRLAIGGAQAAGAALRWYRDLLMTEGSDGDAKAFESLLDEVKDRPSGVVFVPHLVGSRFAFADPSLSATLAGLTLATDRPELTRAILEGVALELAVACERFEAAGIEISGLTAAGGGARSHVWVQIIADVIARPIASTGSGDAGALGAALLAGVGSRAFASFEAAAAAGLETSDAVDPRAADAAWWVQRKTDYKAIVAALSEVAALHRLRGLVPRV